MKGNPTLCPCVDCVQYSDQVHLGQFFSPSQSLDGSMMETSKEQTQRVGLQFSFGDQTPTLSNQKEGGFDWD